MRNRNALALLALLVGCAGGEPAETKPVETAEPVVEAPKEEPKPEAKVDLAAMPEAERVAWLMKRGEEVYKTGGTGGVACSSCHQETGMGVPGAFPPLVGQKDLMGDCVHHAGLVVHGLSGEITVNGEKFNGAMPAQGNLPDEEIAAVITYARNSWGNAFGNCLPEDVAKARGLPAPVLK